MASHGSFSMQRCIQLIEKDLQKGPWNYFNNREVNVVWKALRQDLEEEKWISIPKTLQRFEETFYRINGFQCEKHKLFPNYQSARSGLLYVIQKNQEKCPYSAAVTPVDAQQTSRFDAKGCIKLMLQDLQGPRNNYLLYPNVSRAWQALLQNLKGGIWTHMPEKLHAFEEAFFLNYKFRCEKHFSFESYQKARKIIVQKIPEQITSGIDSTGHPSATSVYTDNQSSFSGAKLESMESDLKNRHSKNYLLNTQVAEKWQLLRHNVENRCWEELRIRVDEFEEMFQRIHHTNLDKYFTEYCKGRDSLLQHASQQQKLQLQISPEITVKGNRYFDVKKELQSMENDMTIKYSKQFLKNTELASKWRVLKRDIENERWQTVQTRLEEFETAFYMTHGMRVENNFPEYRKSRNNVIQAKEAYLKHQESVKDFSGIKHGVPAKSEPSNPKVTYRLETTPKNSSCDADYLQKCILWLQRSLTQDSPVEQFQSIPESGVSFETKQNVKLLEDVNSEYVRIRKQRTELLQHNEHLEGEVRKHRQEIQTFQHQYQTVENMKKEIERLQIDVNHLQQKLTAAEADKQYWINRVSKVAGTKLTSNNPGITDLSDPNRPQKLAEKFGELYDNTWTDALEVLNDHISVGNEVHNIKRLAMILHRCFEYCHMVSVDHLKNLKRVLITIDGKSNGDDEINIPKSLLDARKETAGFALKAVRQKTLECAKYHFEEETALIPDFIESCADICWGMVVHEPKLCFLWLDEGRNQVVNSDQFTLYTKSGTGVEYLVWPAMLLHSKGPILRKGTYQPF